MRRGAPARRPVSPPAKAEDALREQAAIAAWVRILAVHKRALAAIRVDLEHEMTMPRFDLLANLSREDGQTLAALSRSMLVTAGNLTGLVDRAARDGLVERRADPNDRRAWRVHMTPKGQRAFRDAERRHATRIAKLFSALAPAELTTLTRLLAKLRDPMRALAASAAPAARGSASARARPARAATMKRERRRKASPDDEETNR
ncbi:MarR family winged helix-turn-helix transcriptional regulator [Chondromyces crocatus]|uniref:MarR family transcriptional regulator n=1 Tax=Chondromyces crocatus TaxID=52 RepID=A0A0K1EEQ9_CHOCO|nr:MarR family transcriptional regulator [Chondromyces crocatus]AKT39356.1 MarR family transcriptional regulator [Chondromyces crocatus]